MAQEPETSELASLLGTEIKQDAEALMDALGGEIGEAGAVKIRADDYHAYIRGRWSDPMWRAKFLETVGPDHFWSDSHSAFGLTPPRVTKAMVGEQ